MPNYVSPGVYTIEKDISDFAPSINTSIVGVVGYAAKGPTNKATLITSQNNLLRTFGNPSESIGGQGIEGSLEILETTNSLFFVRAAAADAADASATLSIGTCPSVIVSGPTNPNNSRDCFGGPAANDSTPLTLRIQVFDNSGNAKFTDNSNQGKDFTIPLGTAASQALALRSVIGGSLDAENVGVFDDDVTTTAGALGLSGAIVGSFAGSGASLAISACSSTTFDATKGVSALRYVGAASAGNAAFGASGQYASAVRAFGATFATTGTDSASYLVESLHPGTGYNTGVKTNGDTSGNSITVNGLGSQNFSVVVNEDGVAFETFKSSFVGSGVFIEDVINTGETETTSEVIKGNLQKDGADATATKLVRFIDTPQTLFGDAGFKLNTQQLHPADSPNATGAASAVGEVTSDAGGRFPKLLQTAVTDLAGGTNGTESNAALIGDATSDPKTGMQALDDPLLNIGIALIPGIYTQAVQNALITLAETTQNFIALVAPPYAIGTVQDAIDWSNGKSSSTAGSRTAAINSSYAAIYWPHVKVFSTFDGKDRFYDPSIFGARQMAFTDAVADSWFAPAGFRRGRLTKPSETEVKLNQGDRDSLYSGGNVINPIVNFPQQGITIFGQRTTQRNPTALDRINVRRLMIYIRKVILLATQRFVFEPNDEFTWSQIEGVLNPFLDDIRRRRGITEFRVVCDETVNTPLRVDRNELWTKVLVKPTKTAEILIFEINLTNQSAQLGSL